VVNEFGEVGVDHLLIEQGRENIRLLDAGCLCCAVIGSLADTLTDLFWRRVRTDIPAFERVVIETSGLADPAPIMQVLGRDGFLVKHFCLDGVVTCVDAIHGEIQLAEHREALEQAALADRLVLTKLDRVAGDAEALRAALVALNPRAAIVDSGRCEVRPADVLGAGLFDPLRRVVDPRRWLGAAMPHLPRHGSEITTLSFVSERPLAWVELAGLSETLRARPGLLRVKGVLWIAEIDAPVVLHGVRDLVDPPRRLAHVNDLPRESRLVVIGKSTALQALRSDLAGSGLRSAGDEAQL
jgi:G3E family GTPase